MEKYANMHKLNESSIMEQPTGTDEPDFDPEKDRFPSLLPLAMKVAAQTIGQDLVSVQPMTFESEEDRIKRETKIRKDKIDALIEGVDFELREEHEPKGSAKPSLFYLDFIYGDEDETDDAI